MQQLFYSVRTRQALAAGDAAVRVGWAHYSYALVRDKFLPVLQDEGWEPVELLRPEIYGSPADLGAPERPVHLIFKPVEELRILKGAYNIAVLFWEFDRLPSHERLPAADPRRWDIFADYVHCLRMVQEIWVGCEFSRNVLRGAGLENVHVVPAPIARRSRPALAHEPPVRIEITDCSYAAVQALRLGEPPYRPANALALRIAQARQAGGRVIVLVFNPSDSRKNSGAALLGFQLAAGRRAADLLIVKLVTDPRRFSLADIVRDELPARFDEHGHSFALLNCASILLVSGWLPEAEMDRLLAADFYLCTSSAEGQNLPLLEGMLRGAVPISTRSTAMADYITDANAFTIGVQREGLVERLTSAYGLYGAEWAVASRAAVSEAISIALTAPPAQIDAMREAARRTVVGRYGPDAASGRLSERLAGHEQAPGTTTLEVPTLDLPALDLPAQGGPTLDMPTLDMPALGTR